MIPLVFQLDFREEKLLYGLNMHVVTTMIREGKKSDRYHTVTVGLQRL